MSDNFGLHDSGQRVTYGTGAQRDSRKPTRFDLLPWRELKRLAIVYGRGAQKYKPRNWEKGIKMDRYLQSTMNHITDWLEGKDDEDHLGQAMFNLLGLMFTETEVQLGNLPAEFDNVPRGVPYAKCGYEVLE